MNEPFIIELRRSRTTRQLTDDARPAGTPWPRSAVCSCGVRRCPHCEECHTPGCMHIRVVCEQAQAALMRRRSWLSRLFS